MVGKPEKRQEQLVLGTEMTDTKRLPKCFERQTRSFEAPASDAAVGVAVLAHLKGGELKDPGGPLFVFLLFQGPFFPIYMF